MASRNDRGFLRAFGAAVRRLRTDRRLSQEGLAELTGLHRTYVGGIERGERNVGLVNVALIADALAVEPSRLLREAEAERDRSES